MEVTREKLLEIFKEYEININFDNIKDNMNLYDSGLDSLDVMNMLLGIEEKLDLKIPDEDAYDLLTINDFLKYINREPRKIGNFVK